MDEHMNGQAISSGSRVKILALGGAGCRVLSHFFAVSQLPASLCLAVDTDLCCLESLEKLLPKFCLGKNVFRGLSSGGDESLVKQAFDKDAAALSDFCQKADVLIILLGLGGGTGNGAALGLIKLALQSGAFVIVIPILPFSFEGQTKGVRAQGALKAIKLMADLVIPFYNDVLFQSLTETATVKEAFNDGNRWLSQLNSMLVNYLSNDKSAALNGTLNTFVQHFSDKPDHIFWGLGSHEQGDIGQALKSVFEGPF